MRSLPETSHEHHELIEPHVDRLPELAEMIGSVTPEASRRASRRSAASSSAGSCRTWRRSRPRCTGDSNRSWRGATRWRRCDASTSDLRGLFASLCEYSELVADERLGEADQIGLRRVLYRLYSMLKVHLAEENLYLGVLDRNLSARRRTRWRRASTTPARSRCSRLGARRAAASPARDRDQARVRGAATASRYRALNSAMSRARSFMTAAQASIAA